MMKVLILSEGNSPHTIKWVNALSNRGIKIHLISLTSFGSSKYSKSQNLTFEYMNISGELTNKTDGSYAKISYLKTIRRIRESIKIFKPDILHSHYASSYGLLGALTNFHPFIISAWGADIYNFPRKSLLHKLLLQYNLKNADAILSTSKAMAVEISRYVKAKIHITPFGIDLEKFKPKKIKKPFDDESIVIGTVKTLEAHYGIEYLIHAFYLLKNRINNKNLRLLIVGTGSQEKYLKRLCMELNIQKDVQFTGFIDNKVIQDYHNMLDIAVYPSLNESFGVAVLESCACEKPVVVSDCPGFKEVVEDGKTGIIVPRKNTIKFVAAIEHLVTNEEMRMQLGENGRKMVERFYSLDDSVDKMMKIYNLFYH